MRIREDQEVPLNFTVKPSIPSHVDTKEKILIQVVLPVSVSHLVAYNFDVQKILNAYEAAYLRVNLQNILTVYKRHFSSGELSRAITKLGNKFLSIGYLVTAITSIFVSTGMFITYLGGLKKLCLKGNCQEKLVESSVKSGGSVELVVYKVSDTLSISVMSLPTVDEFTTKEKIGMYSIAKNKSTLVYKGTKLYSDYDRIALLEHTKPIFVLTDVEYNREIFDMAKENADFVVIDPTNDTVKMSITSDTKVVTYTTRLSSILSMKKYEEVDLNTLNAILQKLKQD